MPAVLGKKYIIALLIAELLTAAAMFVSGENFDFAVGTDMLPMLTAILQAARPKKSKPSFH